MNCQYKFKSGQRKGKKCGRKLKDGETTYCKVHKRYVPKQNPEVRAKTPDPPKKKSSIGTDTTTDFGNLLSLFQITALPSLTRANTLLDEMKDEKKSDENENVIPPKEISFEIDSNNLNNIDGLLKIIQLYRTRPITEESTINYDLEKLCRIEQDLYKLKNMIGLKKIKNKLVDMIIYLCQKHNKDHKNNKDKKEEEHEFLHTVLQGPPGCGKTTLAHILSSIYKKLGFLSNGKIVFAKRSDLVGKYCGHTAYLTQSKIDEARGGVLFIDEAYSLGNKDDNPDAFSRECIDTLNQNLSERNDFVCIIAGYKQHLDKRFFSVNPGLARRFPWTFSIEGYNSAELKDMFIKKLFEIGFKLEDNAIDNKFFNMNKENFPFFGGSIHTFINKIKICNYKRLFGQLNKENVITKEDIKDAFEMYKLLEMGNKTMEKSKPPFGMYM